MPVVASGRATTRRHCDSSARSLAREAGFRTPDDSRDNGLLTGDLFLYRFRKIPFACSYLPGGANLKVKLGAYGIGFLCLADVGTLVEFWAFDRPARFLGLLALLVAAVVWAHRRRSKFAAADYTPLQFEDLPPADIFALDFRRDSDWIGGEQYVDMR
jgi:hypothetical protein